MTRALLVLCGILLAGPVLAQPRVGLASGPGVWDVGRAALERALGEAELEVRRLELSGLRVVPPELDAIVLPGGWAPDMLTALGAEGVDAIRRYVRGGGGCLAICAGAYLVSDEVRWEGEGFDYPLDLFRGVAAGPVPGLAPWPERGPVRLARVSGDHALQGTGQLIACYYGGPAFESNADEVAVWLRYPDGTAAAVALRCERGRLVLVGPHLEVGPAAHQPASAEARRSLIAALRWARSANAEQEE